MSLEHAIGIALRVAIAAMVIAVGLATSTSDLGYLLRRPGLLARSLLATVVIAPLTAIALWRVLALEPAAALAVVAAGIAPGMPSVPRTGTKLGANTAFASSLTLITTMIAVASVPAWLFVISRIAHAEITVTPLAIARTLTLGILLPLGVGLTVRGIAPTLAARLARPIGAISDALLPGLALVIVLVGVAALRSLSWAAIAAMVLAPAIALVVGHLLGGPDPRDRTVLALADATRFPALAALIATTSFSGRRAIPAVIASLVIAMLLAALYGRWRKHTHPRVAPSERPLAPGGLSPEGA